MRIIRFKNDTRLRKLLYTPESMSHPAKGHCGMWQQIIEEMSKPGDVVLDPMAGIGTTLLAARMGRHVICVEKESHFVEPMRASWAKMQTFGPEMGCEKMGQATIIQGDARNLEGLMADCVVTSPPYEESTAQLGAFKTPNDRTGTEKRLLRETGGYTRPQAIVTSPPYGDTTVEELASGGYGDAWREAGSPKIGLQKLIGKAGYGYTRPSAIVTSPPYEGSVQGEPGIDWTKQADGRKKQEPHGVGTHGFSYTRYERLKTKAEAGEYKGIRPDCWTSPTNIAAQGYLDGYSGSSENIGNLRSGAYWDAMRQVYEQCYKVLADGGVMVLILKGFVRNGIYQNLPLQTQELVESLGFVKQDEWLRELWSLSFWRILQKRKSPETFDDRLNYETIQVYSKPALGEGGRQCLR